MPRGIASLSVSRGETGTSLPAMGTGAGCSSRSRHGERLAELAIRMSTVAKSRSIVGDCFGPRVVGRIGPDALARSVGARPTPAERVDRSRTAHSGTVRPPMQSPRIRQQSERCRCRA